MNKKYHFLTGLPRSGNTLLSAILNQNPQIYSSPLSPLPGIYWNFKNYILADETSLRLKNKDGVFNMINNLANNFYSDIDKPTIIIREKGFATPANLLSIKEHITPKPKIIFTTRPILEVLTSIINLLPEWSYIENNMQSTEYYYKDYLTKNDNRCDFLMQPKGQIDQVLLTANELIKPENKDVFCVIKYDDIVTNPKNVMKKIYNFLELEYYEHDFNNIKKIEEDNDEMLGLPKSLHDIRPKLKKTSQNPKLILSEYVINKYSNIGFDFDKFALD